MANSQSLTPQQEQLINQLLAQTQGQLAIVANASLAAGIPNNASQYQSSAEGKPNNASQSLTAGIPNNASQSPAEGIPNALQPAGILNASQPAGIPNASQSPTAGTLNKKPDKAKQDSLAEITNTLQNPSGLPPMIQGSDVKPDIHLDSLSNIQKPTNDRDSVGKNNRDSNTSNKSPILDESPTLDNTSDIDIGKEKQDVDQLSITQHPITSEKTEKVPEFPPIVQNKSYDISGLNKINQDIQGSGTQINIPKEVIDGTNKLNGKQPQLGGAVYDDVIFLSDMKQQELIVRTILRQDVILRLTNMHNKDIDLLVDNNFEQGERKTIKEYIKKVISEFIYPDVSRFNEFIKKINDDKFNIAFNKHKAEYTNNYNNLQLNIGNGENNNKERIKIDIFILDVISLKEKNISIVNEIWESLKNEMVKFFEEKIYYMRISYELIEILKKKVYDESQKEKNKISDIMNNIYNDTDRPNQIYTFCKIRVDKNSDDQHVLNSRFTCDLSSNDTVLTLGYNKTHIPFYDASTIGKIPNKLFNIQNEQYSNKLTKVGYPHMDIMISKTEKKHYYNIGNVMIGFSMFENPDIVDKFDGNGKLKNINIIKDFYYDNDNNILKLKGYDDDTYLKIYNEITYKNIPNLSQEKYIIIEKYGILIIGNSDMTDAKKMLIENKYSELINYLSTNSELKVYPYLNSDQKNKIFILAKDGNYYCRTGLRLTKVKNLKGLFFLYFNTMDIFNVSLKKKKNEDVNSKLKFRDFKLKNSGSPGSYYDGNTVGFIDSYRFVYDEYIFGPFTQIFNEYVSNKVIVNGGSYIKDDKTTEVITSKIDIVMKFLDSGKNVTIIGYGSSGSGKTSSLIYLNKFEEIDTQDDGKSIKETKEDGILIEICKLYLSDLENKRKIDNKEVKKLEVSFIEFAADKKQMKEETIDKNNINNISPKISMKENKGTFGKGIFGKKGFIVQNGNWVAEEKINNIRAESIETEDGNIPLNDIVFSKPVTLANYIINIMENIRLIKPTPNNDVSSRSHVIVFIRFLINDDSEKEEGPYLIICDFAGVEDKFSCDDCVTLDKFKKIVKKGEFFYTKHINENKEKYIRRMNNYLNCEFMGLNNLEDLLNLFNKEGNHFYQHIYNFQCFKKKEVLPVGKKKLELFKQSELFDRIKNDTMSYFSRESLDGASFVTFDDIYKKITHLYNVDDSDIDKNTNFNLLIEEIDENTSVLSNKFEELYTYLSELIIINENNVEFLKCLFGFASNTDVKEVTRKLSSYMILHFIFRNNTIDNINSITVKKYMYSIKLFHFIKKFDKKITKLTTNECLNIFVSSNLSKKYRIVMAGYTSPINLKILLNIPVIYGMMELLKVYDDDNIRKNCLDRMYEGMFINNSLLHLKDNLSYIINRIQRENKQIETPLFDSRCVKYGCSILSHKCFNSDISHLNKFEEELGIHNEEVSKSKEEFKKIFENTSLDNRRVSSLLYSLNKKICENKFCLDDMVFCVFLVVNLSADKYINNPPVIPFIDIYDLKMERNRLTTIEKNYYMSEVDFKKYVYLNNFSTRNDVSNTVCYDILCRYYTGKEGSVLNSFKKKLGEPLLTEPLMYYLDKQIRNYINSQITSIINDTSGTSNVIYLNNIINIILLSNDKTTVGTLEYTNMMSKFAVDNVSCRFETNPELFDVIPTNITGGNNDQNRKHINFEGYLHNIIHPEYCKNNNTCNSDYIQKYVSNFFGSNMQNIVEKVKKTNEEFEKKQTNKY